eukprot:scaffold33193_cov70-Cyclotella_meneghiniana.AAC.8
MELKLILSRPSASVTEKDQHLTSGRANPQIKQLHDKYGLSWLRISMSYHKISNPGKKLHNDLSSKVMKGIIDKEEQDLPCNCPTKCKKADGTCLHNDQCRQSMVVYELECKLCNQCYIGKTQNHFKRELCNTSTTPGKY